MYEPNNGSPYGAIMLLVIVAVYCYFAYAQYRIAQKAGHSSPWMAWIPIANLVQLVDIAGKPWYWLLLLFVPVVNIVCLAILWMEAAKRIGCSAVWGVLTILPFINLVSIGVMAFGSNRNQVSGHNPPPPYQPAERKEPQQVG